MINYQGKLTTPEGALVDTTIPMEFYIYPTIGGPAGPLWAETLSTVIVEKGVFSVLLGSVNPIPYSIFSGETRYLELIVGDASVMYPRKAIVSVGYAYKSSQSDTSSYSKASAWPPVGKVYDSGWFPVSIKENHILSHNLGTTKVITELWFSTSSDGSNAIRLDTSVDIGGLWGLTGCVQNLTATEISVQTGTATVAIKFASNGTPYYYDDGYYRLLLLALE